MRVPRRDRVRYERAARVSARVMGASCNCDACAARSIEVGYRFEVTTSLDELRAKVRAQRSLNPRMYGNVDFDAVPERFTRDPAAKSMLADSFAKKYRAGILAKDEAV